MEVRIGVQQSPREIVLESPLTAEEITEQVATAVSAGSLLQLVDDRGRQVLVPGERLAYVELGATESRHVGFATA